MNTFRIFTSSLILIAFCGLMSTEALAQRHYHDGSSSGDSMSSTLSWRSTRYLAKRYLGDFQTVDPSISYRDLIHYIDSLNASSVTEAEAALQDYLASLQGTAGATNQAPTISGQPAASVDEGQLYSFSPSASDPEGDSLTFTIVNCPNWASFDSQSGTLSGTPDYSAAGSYDNIQISVGDGDLSSSLPAFSIAVNDVNQDPVGMSPDPVTGAPTLLSASISGDNVNLDWTQENDIPDGGYDIVIDGRDTNTQYRTTATSISIGGLDLSQSHCFAIQARYTSTNEFYDSDQLCTSAMALPNQPPEISGTPQTTVQVGESYSFTPASSDADGDTLSFTAVNLPAWASLDSGTGALTGTPEAQDVGSYSGIEILVTDGEASTSLPPFTLVVEAVQSPTTASTTLMWTAPSTRSDGTALPLSEISGYRIYMGDSETSLAPVMDINDHSVTEYTLTDLTAGSYYFGITAYDVGGNESGLSNIILLPTL